MKFFILPLLATMLISLASCDNFNDDSEMMAKEISEQLTESLKSLNDSSFNDIVITSVNNGSQSDIKVNTSEVTADEKGNLYISISANKEPDYSGEWWVSIVAILAVALMFGGPLFLVFIVCHFIYKSKRDRNRVIMESIASGHTLPDRFYNIPDRKPRLQPAVNYLTWSAGFFAFFIINGKTAAAMLTLIPFIIGVGKLASYIISTRKNKDSDNDSTTFCDNAD
ncbi:hypothetical protein E4T81_02365 [Barnesiella sp. WM24]|uniref:DUF6249 domain-containing protein n=1 Tax=Barnesiella sp. WM24 TaxID=2558278 RepID=UPI0010726884|nr:DUF6249 domain-containing protein [Barnesiella sp. WM24]TFU94724.1 hypothetical protein E4T81_02365 [Barnesiella sp. WM24]